ncbi:NADPH-dependent FMN reductase [Nocardia sp. NPDC050406]|uniref:NADPH-dependent FMN reductase n=1 Tax=Nocardia sp. NPDC050406 TaxID=3364318 RepID=UPI003789325E
MSTTPLRLAIIIGSVREGRFGPVPARWIAEQARRHGAFEVDVIDLADMDLPHALPAVSPLMDPNPVRPAGMVDLTERLDRADAFLIVTPEFNRSYPSSLKAAIDWHFNQWTKKAIGFVGYSGNSGGLLAIEHLRQVFGELHAHTVRTAVTFPRFYLLFDAEGNLIDPTGPEDAATTMLDELHWWASALTAARGVAAAV